MRLEPTEISGTGNNLETSRVRLYTYPTKDTLEKWYTVVPAESVAACCRPVLINFLFFPIGNGACVVAIAGVFVVRERLYSTIWV